MNNHTIINNLELLVNYYNTDKKLKFKALAINKALSYIKKYPYKITSGKYAKENLPSIGDGISRRIDEIIETGTLKELPTLSNNKTFKSLNDLTRITGLGETRARNLIKQGITNVNEYRDAIIKGKVKTTHHIDIGLKYFNDLEKRIPRDEIENMEILLKEELYKLDKNMIYNICGSYRRGAIDCGDIDILITNRVGDDSYLRRYVDRLMEINFLIDHLTLNGRKKYMGVCKIDKYARRIDIRYVDYDAYYASLIYFTGSKEFNIKIRNIAIEDGYSLSEYGLKEKGTDRLICLHSEEEIFDFLNIEYVSPVDR